METIAIGPTYKRVVSRIIKSGVQERSIFYTDFSEVETIEYIPSYFESILHNLIAQSLLNKHKERALEIKIFTFEEDGYNHLVVEDNGVGITNELCEHILQGNYKSFLHDTKQLGFRLYLVKRQVEAFKGSFELENRPNKGLKVTIQFAEHKLLFTEN